MKAIRNVLQVWNIDNAEFLGTLPIALDSQMSQQSSLFGAAKSFADTKSYNDYIEALESLAGAADVAMLQRYHRAVNESLISRLCTFSNSSFRPPLANANTQLLLAAAANSMTVVVCEAAACDSSVLDHDAVISAIYTLYADIIYVTKHNINSSEFGSLMQDSGGKLWSLQQCLLMASVGLMNRMHCSATFLPAAVMSPLIRCAMLDNRPSATKLRFVQHIETC